jgi:hypothetical protein
MSQDKGPLFTNLVTGRWNGKRKPYQDSLGNHYTKLPNGREKRGGARTKGTR